MKVNLNNKESDFVSGYNNNRPSDNGWQKQNQDAFKIAVINGTRVFVKRFEKAKNSIPGYHYIIKTRNKKYNNLPVIYDFVTISENGKSVSYLFQEVLEGYTLEEIMHNDIFNFNPLKFVRQIYSALTDITKNGYWFSDFIEKNIFIANNGDYFLIDLDSVVPLAIMPCEDDPILSNVNKNYKIAVFNYWYKETFKYPFTYIRHYLRGDTINFLELFVFVAQIKYYLEHNLKPNFSDVSTRKAIPNYLLNKNNPLTYAIFKSCFENTSNHQQVLSLPLFESYLKIVLFPVDNMIKIDFQNKKIINSDVNQMQSKKSTYNTVVYITDDEENLKKEKINQLLIAINNNLNRKQHVEAENNISQLKNLDSSNLQLIEFEKIINKIKKDALLEEKQNKFLYEAQKKDEIKNKLIKDNITPYKCPSCSYPVKQNEGNVFNSIMYLGSAVGAVIFLWQFLAYWALSGIIGGPLIWKIMSAILPDSWTKEKLECSNCYNEYYYTKDKY